MEIKARISLGSCRLLEQGLFWKLAVIAGEREPFYLSTVSPYCWQSIRTMADRLALSGPPPTCYGSPNSLPQPVPLCLRAA